MHRKGRSGFHDGVVVGNTRPLETWRTIGGVRTDLKDASTRRRISCPDTAGNSAAIMLDVRTAANHSISTC